MAEPTRLRATVATTLPQFPVQLRPPSNDTRHVPTRLPGSAEALTVGSVDPSDVGEGYGANTIVVERHGEGVIGRDHPAGPGTTNRRPIPKVTNWPSKGRRMLRF